ncbi:hypothetical protein [Halovivax limisalsi]|uniref:hypothetical protein n=1 Tax=Halovivax limisalsi TaxID=1453760 RepID=UPI001FFD760A|nr:hypothetical protein [Halovivax limisalsi]
MDTNYWISLKQDPDRFKSFYETASSDDVQVYFSTGNFIDLVKAKEQDLMTKIIVAIADKVLPPTPEKGHEFYVSDYFLDIVPDDEYRATVRREISDLPLIDILQQAFRDSTWSATDEYFVGMEQTRDLIEEWGHDNLKGVAFEDYLKRRGDQYVLHEHEVDIVEYVKKEIYFHRVLMMDPNEAVKENDVADMLVCTQAILSDCDMLLIEAKWANLGLVEAVTENIDGETELEIYKDFEAFHRELRGAVANT